MNERELERFAIKVFEMSTGEKYVEVHNDDYDAVSQIMDWLRGRMPPVSIEQAVAEWELVEQMRAGKVLKKPVTSFEIEHLGNHDRIKIWVNHSLAGSLIVAKRETEKLVGLFMEDNQNE